MTRQRPVLAFVLQKSLGWDTYRRQLERVLDTREDVDAHIFPVALKKWQTLFFKRNNMHGHDHFFRFGDPIMAYRKRRGNRIRAIMKQVRPVAVHCAAHWPGAAVADPKLGLPFTVALDNTRAGIERDLPRGAWSARDMASEAELLRQADRVYPMSRWAAESVSGDCGVPQDRISIMPPSVDLSQFHPRPIKTEVSRPLRIIFIGNDFRRKGGDALKQWVAGPLANQAELHIVSGDPSAQGKALGVVAHGRVPNDRLVSELLPEMDVLCLPTRSDMSPQVLAEAAAAGLPAVASRVGGIPDLVEHDRTGFLVPPDDEAGFIAALEVLATDRARLRIMGDAARQRAERMLNAERNFNRLIDTLLSIGRTDQEN